MRMGVFAVIFDAERRVLLCHRRDIDARIRDLFPSRT
jgi:hypothetical protein